MALTEIEAMQIKKAVAAFVERRRPPVHIRPKLDIGFRVSGQSVEIFEVRPARLQPDKTIENPVAKATFVRTRGIWRVFWMRADLEWHRYDPSATVGSIDRFLELVDADPHACFWG